MSYLLSREARQTGSRIADCVVRPVRIAFCVSTDDPTGALGAIEASCLTWGGAGHAIIPRTAGQGLTSEWNAFLTRYDPDMVVDLADAPATEIEEHQRIGRGVQTWVRPYSIASQPGSWLYSGMISTGRPLPDPGVICPVPTIPDDHPLRLPLAAKWGSLNESNVAELLRHDGLNPALRLSEITLCAMTSFADATANELLLPPAFVSPTGAANSFSIVGLPPLTMIGVRRSWPSWPMFDPGSPRAVAAQMERTRLVLVTGVRDSIADLALYWTIRGTRPDTSNSMPLWLPIDVLESDEGAEALRRALSLHRGYALEGDELYVLSATANEDTILRALPQHSNPTVVVTSDFHRFIPGHHRVGEPSTQVLAFEKGDCHVPVPAMPALAHFDRLALEVKIEGSSLPQIPALRHDIMGAPWRITRVGSLSHMFYPSAADKPFPMSVPNSWRVLEACVEESGGTCSPSDKGRLALGVIDLIGGVERLGFLSSSLLTNVLVELAAHEGRQWFRRRLAEIAPGLGAAEAKQLEDAVVAEEPDVERSRASQTYDYIQMRLGGKHCQPVVDCMIERGVLLRGVSLTCPRCGLARWYSADSFGSQFTCVGCRWIGSTPLKGSTTTWRYRVNELIGRAIDQGVLPHLILARHRIAASYARDLLGFFPGVLISWDGRQAEVDYVEISGGRVTCGECKVSGSEMSIDDVEKLASVGERLSADSLLLSATHGSIEIPAPEDAGFEVLGGDDLLDRFAWSSARMLPQDYMARLAEGFDRP